MDGKLYIGLIAGILTAVSVIPQIIKIIKEKKAQNVSPMMFIILLGGNGTWFYYGLLIEDIPIMATNAFSFLLDLIMIILNYKYSKSKR